MSASPHPDHAELCAFLAGTLDPAAHEQIEFHIATCEACCKTLREIPDDGFMAQFKDAADFADLSDVKPQVRRRDLSVPDELHDHPRYKLGKLLGAGGMGVVYKAEHRLMDRTVAIKILRRDLMRNPRVQKRFRLEFKAAARLSHPNIVAVYDADQAGDAHFLVMEYVDGVSLDRLVARRGAFEPAYACHFIRQAARGLEHAFEAGMVHRDIKPQNLMLTRKGQVKILDFGLARVASESRVEFESGPAPDGKPAELTHVGDVMGTPAYMAPEQADDATQADIRADIYGLGSTLYFLLTGQPPYGVGAPRSKLLSKAHAQPVPIGKLRPDLPVGLVAVIDKMMATDPAARFQTPAEVVAALAEFAKPTSETAPAKKAEDEPILDVSRHEAQNFLARCPFCMTRLRIPARSLGDSLQCPQCGSFFTSVPEDDSRDS